jgi:carboxyl-terminal processing protease
MKRHILFLLVVVCLAAVPRQVSAQQAARADAQVRQKTFEKVWRTVNEKYFDPNFGGLDWRAVRESYAPQAAAVKTDADLHQLLNRMLGELKVSHMQVVTPEQLAVLKAPPVSTGVVLREVGNQLVIARLIENSSAAKAGLKTGYAVVKVDGEAVKSLAEAQRKLAGAANTSVRLSYLDEKDELREAVLERLPLTQAVGGKLAGISFYALFESRRLADDIGYLRFSNFAGFLSPQIREAMEAMKGARGLIIDLRGNSGGEDSVAISLAGMLFDKETQLMVTRTRKGEDFYYKARPQKNAFLGPVVILLDEASGSASEQLAAGLQEAGRAVVVGKKTAGKDLDADVLELPTGAYLIYASGQPHTPKGVVIEGRGVIPDVEVSLTREGLLAGRDAQLEAAINHIKAARP